MQELNSVRLNTKNLMACIALRQQLAVGLLSVNPLPHGDANRHTIFKRKD